jgi:signal transduction histidine kinase
LRELAAHLQSIREQERSRIARELHDELGQALTALGLEVRRFNTRLPEEHRDLRERTQSMTDLISATADSVRRICSELRPALLDDLGLSAAIEWQGEEFTRRWGIACDIESTPAEIRLPDELSVAIFRVFQETLTNIARHAHASEVNVRLRLTPGEFRMRVCDDGVGMKATGERKANSFGLLGVRERVRGFGGEVLLSTGSEGGTCLEVVIPTAEFQASPLKKA